MLDAVMQYAAAGGSLAQVGIFVMVLKQFAKHELRILRLEIKTGNERPQAAE